MHRRHALHAETTVSGQPQRPDVMTPWELLLDVSAINIELHEKFELDELKGSPELCELFEEIANLYLNFADRARGEVWNRTPVQPKAE